MNLSKRYASVGKACVACGSCVNVCPREAIRVPNGVIAVVDTEKCIGCGKCAGICPAAIITITDREEAR